MGVNISKKKASLSSQAPIAVIQASQKATSKAKQSYLYKPQVDKRVLGIQGNITFGHLVDIQCEDGLLSVFDLSHAFVIFEFSTGEYVRCELSGYLDGTAIFINLIKTWTYSNWEKYKCTSKDETIHDVVRYSNNYYSKGNYHLEHRNCYDYCSYMLLNDFGQGAYDALRWKKIEINQVPTVVKLLF